ncbi:hypothetical protein [Streptomyces iranensis]|uniref:Uncharacterized protein n=1 Tax=Streptomyces iranensis TaxID=576784 RepID=A0A060ZC97_9ACTN|nr:hypothetical protein [Streptomyces iranensis]MBP2063218.1 hypothetical protein [Streptomyces iranensis]CDR02038.1 predicted protein [Streptomyces iranensis]
MSSPHTSSPAPDATVIRVGRRSALTGLPCSIVLMVIGAVGIFGVVLVATGKQKGESTVTGYVGLAFAVALGVLGIVLFIPFWANRRSRILIDHTGFWLEKGGLQRVIPWNSVAGVALYWSEFGRNGKIYSLELYPTATIDRDDPLLWSLVRDEEPLHPGLPRLRHRVTLTAPNQRPVAEAVRSRVPHIWLGESQRAAGHIGRPDIRGHRQRTRGRTS